MTTKTILNYGLRDVEKCIIISNNASKIIESENCLILIIFGILSVFVEKYLWNSKSRSENQKLWSDVGEFAECPKKIDAV